MPSADAAEGGTTISLSPEVAPGEIMIVSMFAPSNHSLALVVNAPTGEAFRAFVPDWNGTRVFRIEVSDAWGFGHGSVEATVQNATARETLFATFEVVCPATCLSGQISRSIAASLQTVWVIVAAMFIVVFAFVLHANHVYRVDNGELSAWERLILLTRIGMRRMPDRRDFVDKTGAVPEGLRKQLQDLVDAADHLAKVEVLMRKGERQKRLLEAEIVLRKERIQRKAGKRFKGWRRPKRFQIEKVKSNG